MTYDPNSKQHSLTHMQNMSFDETNQLNTVELVGADSAGNVRKVPVNTDGTIKLDPLPTATSNPPTSYDLTSTTATIQQVIGLDTYQQVIDWSTNPITEGEWVKL